MQKVTNAQDLTSHRESADRRGRIQVWIVVFLPVFVLGFCCWFFCMHLSERCRNVISESPRCKFLLNPQTQVML